MSGRILIIAALALAIALAVRWWLPVGEAPHPALTAPDTRFDYTLEEFHARFRDDRGQVELLLSGPRLEHVSTERVGYLHLPRFHIEPENANWRGRADIGRVLRDSEVVELEHNVELRHHDPRGEIRIQTDHLRYERGTRTITSRGPVEVHQSGSWLRAGGLTIQLDTNVIELTRHVQGEIQPAVLSGSDDDDGPGGG